LRSCSVVLAIVIMWFGVAAVPAAVTQQMWTQVQVRVYDTSGQTKTERAVALALAADILSVTKTAVAWRVCDQQDLRGHRDDCDARVEAGTLLVRILRSSRSSQIASGSALGHAIIDTRTGTGVLATVYFDRVAQRAAHARVSQPRLLGRAIAHELGHLLLSTTAHSAEGLMRAEWTRDELRAELASDWIFTPVEIVSIQSRPRRR
jgi:hypothetical protein